MSRKARSSGDDAPSRDAALQRVLTALPLMGRRVEVVNPIRSDDGDVLGGGDIDCVVDELDPLWPLRVPSDVKLVQCLHYDVDAWQWIVEVAGRTFTIDTLDDARGIGSYGFPTGLWFDSSPGTSDGVRAAYLTSKRIRKDGAAPEKWDHVRSLAIASPTAFRRSLDAMFGDAVAGRLAEAVVAYGRPPPSLRREAEWHLWRRRFGTPTKLISYLARSAGRIVERVRYPTGMTILVAGPDGSGKSTLATSLPEACKGPFRRSQHLQWRPGVLPPLSRMFGMPEDDMTEPHDRPPHGSAISLAGLLYYWFDFLIGGWTIIAASRMRSVLVIVERGWWDIAVDPRRYRMNVSPKIVTALGALLPKPDLAFLLEASPALLLARKSEIAEDEIARQMVDWRSALPGRTPRGILDASKPVANVRIDARNAIFDHLGRRALSRVGMGWFHLPTKRSSQWVMPRGPALISRRALSIYQPMTLKGAVGWQLARMTAGIGGFRLASRRHAPPAIVLDAVRPHLPARATVASMRADHPSRYVAAIVSDQARLIAIAKVASDSRGREALAREAEALVRLSPNLPRPLLAPRVLASSEGLLLLEAYRWTPRIRPWRLPPEVAHALGRFHHLTARGGVDGAAHGDAAPWNLLQGDDGWLLVDWEEARMSAPPFFDVFHYLIQAHALLKRPGRDELLTGITAGNGWIGACIRAYASGAEVAAEDAPRHVDAYLRLSLQKLDPQTPDGRRVLDVRNALAMEIHGSF